MPDLIFRSNDSFIKLLSCSFVLVEDSTLEKVWKLFSKRANKEGQLDRKGLKAMLDGESAMFVFGGLSVMGTSNEEAFDSLFRAFDLDQSGSIDFIEVSLLLHAYSTKSLEGRLKVREGARLVLLFSPFICRCIFECLISIISER